MENIITNIKMVISLLIIPFKILVRMPSFILNAIRPFKQIFKKANSYYADYQKFMGISDMPEFGLIYHRLNPVGRATEDFGSCGCDMYILNLNNGAYNKKLKATLFHEFTHIYDDELFIKKHRIGNTDIGNRRKYVYEEIHAEQVKILYMLGCKIITDISKIDHNTMLLGIRNKMVTFHDYCIEYRDELNAKIDIMKSLQNSNGIFSMSIEKCNQNINFILYYIGTISIYKKYCTYDIDNVMDVSYITDYLGQGIKRLVEIYCTDTDMEDIPKGTIIESSYIRVDIMNFIKNELRIVK